MCNAEILALRGFSGMQLALFDEHHLYHQPERYGYFSILARDRAGVPRQSSYALPKLDQVLPLLPKDRDSWLSQAEFVKPNRRIVNLARIGLLFADLDTYRQPWAQGRPWGQLVTAVLYHCEAQGIPPPSVVIFSGRGLQAKWVLDAALPRHALPRWNRAQAHLVERLAAMGADLAAKDASRVLRIVNTVNSKSGEVCRVVHVTPGPDGTPIRYNFEALAQVLLPLARQDIERQRQERAERAPLRLVHSGNTSGLHRFSGRQLAWDRLEDLRKLAELRGGVVEGERMQHLFWRMNFLLLSGATHSGQMYHEAAALARELDPRWSYASRELMTLYSKAQDHEAGKTVEFGGQHWSPLYTPRNDTLISMFKITDAEQRELRTVISKYMAAERDKERLTARRRADGAVERAAYEAAALSREKPWESLGISRATWYRAGKPPA